MLKAPPSIEAVAAFIEKIHILYGISEDDLFDISERLEDKHVEKGEVILEQDQRAESFYIIYAGKVDVTRTEKGQLHSCFSSGDYFGADVFFEHDKRNTKITAKEEVLLLELPSSVFSEIPEAIDFLRTHLKAFLICRELLERVNFDWVEDDEGIYFVVNKHPILFWRRAPLPALLTLGSIGVAFWGMWVGSLFPLIVGSIGFIVGLLWLIWDWLDYGNDYYIVTNKRVIWLEKIIGIFDSQKEAQLDEVKSVDAKTDAVVQSFFDYGHVNVNTIFGGVNLQYIPFPRQAHLLIEELWNRAQQEDKQQAKARLQKAIKEQIESAKAVEEKKRKGPPKIEEPKPQKSLSERLFGKRKKKGGKLFSLRFEEGKEIVYRKHIVILLRQIIMPTALSAFLGIYLIYQLYLFFLLQSTDAMHISFILLIALGTAIALGWLAYQYVDWSNDIFKVSEDKIFDIDRKPFGDVQSRSAELKNIESTEYQRHGIISVFFNYGTVYIHIGSEEFEFEDVLDPAGVQQDINHRYHAVQEKAKLEKEKKERNEMIKWLVAYHESTPDIDDMLKEIEEIKRQNAQEEDEAGEEGMA